MLDPSKVAERLDLTVDFKLDDRQRRILIGSLGQEHWKIVQTLMEEELKKFNVRLMNTPMTSPEDVIANHAAAKICTQFYVGFMQRLSEEVKVQYEKESELGTKQNPEQPNVAQDFV